MQTAAREVLRVRKAAKVSFGAPALSEVAWTIMLALFAFDENARKPHIASVAARADLPRTTVLRCLVSLERRGLLRLFRSRDDKRALFVELTFGGRQAMHRSFVSARFTR